MTENNVTDTVNIDAADIAAVIVNLQHLKSEWTRFLQRHLRAEQGCSSAAAAAVIDEMSRRNYLRLVNDTWTDTGVLVTLAKPERWSTNLAAIVAQVLADGRGS